MKAEWKAVDSGQSSVVRIKNSGLLLVTDLRPLSTARYSFLIPPPSSLIHTAERFSWAFSPARSLAEETFACVKRLR